MEAIDFLPLVKAYPALSQTYGEVSCVAGVQTSGVGTPRWVRLYPVPFRALSENQRFAKYQPMRLSVETHAGDRRPETRRPNRDSIEVRGEPISTANGWEHRRRFVEPLMVESMCALRRCQRTDGTSLGVFRPKRVIDLVIEPADCKAEKARIARAWAAQGSLLDGLDKAEKGHQLRELELIPWSFKYHYECEDAECPSHTQSIIDWEIAEFFRGVRRADDWRDKVRSRWVNDLCAPDRDTAFFVGNQHQFPQSFLVLGVWWPEYRPEQLSLGDIGDL